MEEWARELLEFWFALDPQSWWKADPAFDEAVRKRYRALWEEQRQRPVADFTGSAEEALAAIILFDQVPRNMFRGHADSFATDHVALAVARAAVDLGYDRAFRQPHRGFFYMPFQHSEGLDDQERSLTLFTALGDDYQLRYARLHHDVVARFGRFPHRNAILGRTPRPDEIAAGDVVPW
ncbi:MAG TPA: DUF924 family protein [Allosphingosinicella sp.]|nr:DUF924 family protein [Allosphingosinicella sp.]